MVKDYVTHPFLTYRCFLPRKSIKVFSPGTLDKRWGLSPFLFKQMTFFLVSHVPCVTLPLCKSEVTTPPSQVPWHWLIWEVRDGGLDRPLPSRKQVKIDSTTKTPLCSGYTYPDSKTLYSLYMKHTLESKIYKRVVVHVHLVSVYWVQTFDLR